MSVMLRVDAGALGPAAGVEPAGGVGTAAGVEPAAGVESAAGVDPAASVGTAGGVEPAAGVGPAGPAAGVDPAASVGPAAGVDPAAALGSLSPLVALALREALQGFTTQEIRLKWPNDLLTPGGKLAGILIEVKQAATLFPKREGDGKEQLVIIGMGINVARPGEGGWEAAAYLDDVVARPDEADDVDDGAALTDAPAEPDEPHKPAEPAEPPGSPLLEDVAGAVIGALLRRYAAWQQAGGSFASYVLEYEAHMAQLGQEVCVCNALGGVIARGVATGIDHRGQLLLQNGPDTICVAAGEITLRHS